MTDEIKARTKHGEMSIDQLAEVQPGMMKIMKDVGDYYYYAYYAAKGGNWKLAAHELNHVRADFRVAKLTRPKFAADLDAFDAEYLVPIFKAIQRKDWAEFESTFDKGIGGSDKYHDKHGYDYVRFLLPKEPPAHLYLGPPEGFKKRYVERNDPKSDTSI